MGFACGYAIALAAGGVFIVAMIRRHLPPTPLAKPVLAPLVACLAVVASGRAILAPLVDGPVLLALAALGSGALFLAVIALLDRDTWAVLRATLSR
jgi:hypothetical protein